MLADQAEALLVLCRGRIFHPEHAVLLDALAEARGFNGRQTVVHVVQQVFIEAIFAAHGVKQFRSKIEVLFG